jgi:hypothetical protein
MKGYDSENFLVELHAQEFTTAKRDAVSQGPVFIDYRAVDSFFAR